MIKETELRIGNKVLDNNDFEMVVIGIYKGEVLLDFPGNEGDYHECLPETLKGIPLNEEVLLEVGFRKIGGLFILRSIEVFCKEDYTSVAIITRDTEMYVNASCKYLHQIQNLYHALYGVEIN